MLKHNTASTLGEVSLITVQDNTMLKPSILDVEPYNMFNYRSG